MTPKSPFRQAFDKAVVESHMDYVYKRAEMEPFALVTVSMTALVSATEPQHAASIIPAAGAFIAAVWGVAKLAAWPAKNPAGCAEVISGQLVAGAWENRRDIMRLRKIATYVDRLTAPYEKTRLPDKVREKITLAMNMAVEPLSRLRVYDHVHNDNITAAENLYEYAQKRLPQFTFTRDVLDEDENPHELKLLSIAADTRTPTPDMPAIAKPERKGGDEHVRIELEIENMLDHEPDPMRAAAKRTARRMGR